MEIKIDSNQVVSFLKAERTFGEAKTQFMQYLFQVLEKSTVSCDNETK